MFWTSDYDVKGQVSVISGASQGLGLAIAKQLYAKGSNVIIISRSESKLIKAVESIEQFQLNDTQFAKYYSADLSVYNDCEGVAKWLKSQSLVVDNLICCAGSSYPEFFVNLTLKQIDQGIDINYKTAAYLIHALRDNLINGKPYSSEKHLMLLSSSVAFYSFIGYSQYSPMKAALKALGDALRHEFKPYGITVHTIFPGNFDSEGYAEENLTKPSITKEIEGSSVAIPVDKCAEIVLGQSLGKGKLYVCTDFIGWVLSSFSLGFNPRDWGIVQVLFALVGAIAGRFVDMFHEYLIKQYFAKEGLPGRVTEVQETVSDDSSDKKDD
ncbi:hypothetical protein CANARDRAFT_7055 [[Candida] arabinofermentans NRRL YB-2248]|uniref:3-ketodihydrosphingosine reductase TSC10 n=1 Tax=[Candida] arabinofermentans NRRL YB-2248 TaxID=983967 RepID=A0A1E4T1P6_9ASCO|nr:hypothetical protein CANARDRAFT_7055 [[Candida] arabinofermentans NRRL YB-2248]